VQLSAKQKTALRRNRPNLRRLSIKKISLKKKRQIIKRRLSGCHFSTGTSYSRRNSDIESIRQALMQHAKKLVIVDPRLLNQLQVDREYKHIQRPADALAKTSLSLDISYILRDDSIPEDFKAQQYQDAL